MNITPILLIVIGVMLLYVVYLQLRLSFTPRPTFVVIPQAREEPSGCGTPVALFLMTIAALVLIVLIGVPAFG